MFVDGENKNWKTIVVDVWLAFNRMVKKKPPVQSGKKQQINNHIGKNQTFPGGESMYCEAGDRKFTQKLVLDEAYQLLAVTTNAALCLPIGIFPLL